MEKGERGKRNQKMHQNRKVEIGTGRKKVHGNADKYGKRD